MKQSNVALSSHDRRVSARFLSVLLIAQIGSAWLAASASESPQAMPVAMFSLLPLLIVVCILRTAPAALCGVVWGFTAGAVIAWRTHDLVLPFVSTATVSALSVAGFCIVAAQITRRFGFNPFVLATLWVLVEAFREPFVGDRGILSLAGADTGTTNVIGNILGYAFVGFLVTLVNGLVVHVALGVCRLVSRPSSFSGCGRPASLKRDMNAWVAALTDAGWPRRTRAPPFALAFQG